MPRPCRAQTVAQSLDRRDVGRTYRANMFAAEALSAISVCCALLVAAAVVTDGSENRLRNFHATMDADVPRGFHYATTDRTGGETSSCCGASSGARDERNPREIPLSVIRALNQVSNVSELFSKFMPDVNMHEAQNLVAMTGFQSRTAFNAERKATVTPKPAGCSVEVHTVDLKDSDDPSLYYYPPCTRINRCNGCCAHDLLSCQPTKSETLNFEVLVSQYNEEGKLEFKGRKSVSVVQHLKCKCDCTFKAEHCTPLQTYYPDDCRCMCNNEEDRDKCSEEYDIKFWNPSSCTCQCKTIQECTSGFGFNYNTCRCEALRKRIKNTTYELNKNVYSLGP